jgi:hypothetical protein
MKKPFYKFLKLQNLKAIEVMVYRWKLKLIFVTFVLLYLSGCGGIGPGTVARDRFGYTDAISDSWKRQMLLNMVKIRYADAPIFLDVASVINQYSLETELSGGLSWNAFLPTQSETLSGRGKYADRPTITYQPLTGEKFTRSMMVPIPPAAILSLIQAGWRADLVFRICVQSINGIYNRVGGRLPARLADPDFYRLVASLHKIQKSVSIGMRIREKDDGKQKTMVVFRKEDIGADIEAEIDSVKKLLGLNPESQEFKIVYGALAKDDQEIAILSRSMLEILFELGSYIEVPESHVAENRATPAIVDDMDTATNIPPLIRIQSGEEKPSDGFVVVYYRDHWFWIDDRDFKSKRMFSFLMFLFTLAETGTPTQPPLLTIPAG